ncbi:MAG: Mrp/NBP35 family ATP-binding protein [Planctomycetes bacterium]|nr:Mrp/NBP35 family ATP-binding protein [Planctomycetota bacterium]
MTEKTRQQTRPRDDSERQMQESQREKRMQEIGFKLLVLSGKGGVGKSTVAANMALSLALQGKTVGLLDVDVHGPSIPQMLGLEDREVRSDGHAMVPVNVGDNLKVMSMGFMLASKDEPVVWRGPMKYNAIRQFLGEVAWGRLDYLVVDSPPGTGDEPLTVAQLVGSPAGAVIVTTPQDLAISDVRRCVSFCRAVSLPVVGIVENMSGYVCPKCGEKVDLFKTGGGRTLASEMGVPFLGRIPIDPEIVSSGDAGAPFVCASAETPGAKAFDSMVRAVVAYRA